MTQLFTPGMRFTAIELSIRETDIILRLTFKGAETVVMQNFFNLESLEVVLEISRDLMLGIGFSIVYLEVSNGIISYCFENGSYGKFGDKEQIDHPTS